MHIDANTDTLNTPRSRYCNHTNANHTFVNDCICRFRYNRKILCFAVFLHTEFRAIQTFTSSKQSFICSIAATNEEWFKSKWTVHRRHIDGRIDHGLVWCHWEVLRVTKRAVSQGQNLAGHLSLQSLYSTTGHQLLVAASSLSDTITIHSSALPTKP